MILKFKRGSSSDFSIVIIYPTKIHSDHGIPIKILLYIKFQYKFKFFGSSSIGKPLQHDHWLIVNSGTILGKRKSGNTNGDFADFCLLSWLMNITTGVIITRKNVFERTWPTINVVFTAVLWFHLVCSYWVVELLKCLNSSLTAKVITLILNRTWFTRTTTYHIYPQIALSSHR